MVCSATQYSITRHCFACSLLLLSVQVFTFVHEHLTYVLPLTLDLRKSARSFNHEFLYSNSISETCTLLSFR